MSRVADFQEESTDGTLDLTPTDVLRELLGDVFVASQDLKPVAKIGEGVWRVID